MSFHKIKSGRVVTIPADNFVGEKGTIFYEEAIGDLRLSDGNTVGGKLLAVSLASLVVEGNTTSGNIIPSSNETYDLGSPSFRFRSLYVSGNTINIGGASISATENGISLTSSTGASFTVSGTSATDTTGSFGAITATGNVTTGNVSGTNGVFTNVSGTLITAYQPNITAVGTLGNLVVTGNINSSNVITSSIYTNSYFYANGQPIKTGSLNVTSNTPPINPVVGDMWYKTNTGVLYRYSNDGTSSFWLDINGPTGYT